MRENRTHGSEGGEGESPFRPLSNSREAVGYLMFWPVIPAHAGIQIVIRGPHHWIPVPAPDPDPGSAGMTNSRQAAGNEPPVDSWQPMI